MKESNKKSPLRASFNTMRVGMRYKLVNHGDTSIFEVLEILSGDDCVVRSLDTLETFNLKDLIRFGMGEDYEFDEI